MRSLLLLWGNSGEILPKIARFTTKKENREYLSEIGRLKSEWASKLASEADSSRTPVRPQYIIKVLNEKLSQDAIISLDVGDNGWWFGRNFVMEQTQKLVMSGYLASMGTGFPGAMAAKLIYPERQSICITGDGGFAMVMGDFLTAVKHKLPVKVFLFNNRQLGMITQEQKIERYPNWKTELHNCDFAQYAQNCGGEGIKVTKPGDLGTAVDQALSSDKPVIVDIDTDLKRFVR